MELHIQIFGSDVRNQFIEILDSIGAEYLISIGDLYITTRFEVERLGKIAEEILYICKLHKFAVKFDFKDNLCYITITP